MNRSLVTFGDSWPAGSELTSDQHPFGYTLAKLLDASAYSNCAVPATSNEHMLLQLGEYARQQRNIENHIAVFFITYPGRSCLIDYQGNFLEVRPDANADKNSREYLYFKYFHTPAQEKFKTHQTILALQRMSAELKLQDFYIVGWVPDIDLDWPGIDKNKFYNYGQTTCAEWLDIDPYNFEEEIRSSPFVRPNHCHPNQQGHEIIAHKLYDWIKDKIV